MIDGSMQDYPLTLNRFLDHAARWHGEAEVATARDDGSIGRTTYAALRSRSLAISSLLAGFGIGQGDRVATLAWNSTAHVELWYAVMGMGAVCHTLNPRLTGPQLASMAVRSGAKMLVASADLLPLAKLIAERATGIERLLLIDGAAGEGDAAGMAAVDLETLIADAPGGAVWGDFPETAPMRPLFHLGHHGRAKGGDLYAPRQLPPHAAQSAGRRHGLHQPRRGARGGADVPRQRLGAALRAARGRRQAGAAGASRRRRQPRAADRRRGRHHRGRRADGVARARRASRSIGRRFALARTHHRRRRADGARANGADRKTARRHRPDELGDDRIVAARRDRAARRSAAQRRGVGRSRRSASICG